MRDLLLIQYYQLRKRWPKKGINMKLLLLHPSKIKDVISIYATSLWWGSPIMHFNSSTSLDVIVNIKAFTVHNSSYLLKQINSNNYKTSLAFMISINEMVLELWDKDVVTWDICMCWFVCVSMYVCVFVFVCVFMCVFECVCVCVF